MPVGKKKTFYAALKGPRPYRGSVGTCASGTAVFASEGFNRGGGIHIGDRNNFAGVGDGGEFVPGSFDLANIGHIRHGTARAPVRQEHHLGSAAEDVLPLRQ